MWCFSCVFKAFDSYLCICIQLQLLLHYCRTSKMRCCLLLSDEQKRSESLGLWQGQEALCWAERADLESKCGEVLCGQCSVMGFLLICLLCLSNVPGAVQEWPDWLLRGCSPPSRAQGCGDPELLYSPIYC